jgi:hypothetical protein
MKNFIKKIFWPIFWLFALAGTAQGYTALDPEISTFWAVILSALLLVVIVTLVLVILAAFAGKEIKKDL